MGCGSQPAGSPSTASGKLRGKILSLTLYLLWRATNERSALFFWNLSRFYAPSRLSPKIIIIILFFQNFKNQLFFFWENKIFFCVAFTGRWVKKKFHVLWCFWEFPWNCTCRAETHALSLSYIFVVALIKYFSSYKFFIEFNFLKNTKTNYYFFLLFIYTWWC